MLIIITLLTLIFILIIVLYQRKNKKTPVRLQKQTTLVEKVQNFTERYYGYLFVIVIIIAFILFAMCVLAFMPGTESGLWYNGGVENVVS